MKFHWQIHLQSLLERFKNWELHLTREGGSISQGSANQCDSRHYGSVIRPSCLGIWKYDSEGFAGVGERLLTKTTVLVFNVAGT